MEQGSADWHKARVGLVTGSRAGAILGLSKWADRDSVMRDMVREYFGAPREFTGNEATEHGNTYEPLAIQDYELLTGHDVQPAGFLTNPDIPWIGVSPDGLIGDDGGVEVKCPYRGGIQTFDDKPDYLAQVCLSLIVTGREWWDFYVKIIDNGRDEDYYHTEIDKKTADYWWKQNKDDLKAFHDEYLEIIADKERAAPYLKDLEIDASGDETWQELSAFYLDEKKKFEEAKSRLDAAKAALTEFAEHADVRKVHGCGVQAYQATRKGSVNYSKIPELKGVDLDKYRGKDSTYWTVK